MKIFFSDGFIMLVAGNSLPGTRGDVPLDILKQNFCFRSLSTNYYMTCFYKGAPTGSATAPPVLLLIITARPKAITDTIIPIIKML